MSYDSSNNNYPPSVAPCLVSVGIIFDGKIGKPLEIKVVGIGVGKRVNWEDAGVVSDILTTQMHRDTLGKSYAPMLLSM